jgi:hypothetical protein
MTAACVALSLRRRSSRTQRAGIVLSLFWLVNEVVNGALLDVLVFTAGIAVTLGFVTAAFSR